MQITCDRRPIPGKDGGWTPKTSAGGPPLPKGRQTTTQAEHSSTSPAPLRSWIWRSIGIFGLRRALFPTAAAYALGFPRLPPATDAVVTAGRRPDGQDRESLPAWRTSAAANPSPVAILIVCLFSSDSMTDDGLVVAKRTPPRQKTQRDYPGSVLSSVSGSAIKKIKAGVKACS